MKKLLIVLLVVFVGGYLYMTSKPPATQESQIQPTPSTESSVPTTELTRQISMEELAKHSTKEDCWIGIEGSVYDVTPYVSSGFHPGKLAILMGCGKDATSLFNARPNGSGAHSERARSMLPKYYAGELTQ